MVKLYQVVDDIIPCIEKPKDTTEGTMGLINPVKLQDIKPIHKTPEFYTSNDKIPKKEIMKTDLLKIAKSIKIKCTGKIEPKIVFTIDITKHQ